MVTRRDIPNTFTTEDLRRRYNLDKEAENNIKLDEIIERIDFDGLLGDKVISISNGGTGVTSIDALKALLGIKGKSIITAALPSATSMTYSPANSCKEIPLNQVSCSIGDGLTFEDSKITIGNGIQRVKISGSVSCSGIANSMRCVIRLLRGGEYTNLVTSLFRNPNAAYTNTISVTPFIAEVQEGDKIQMNFVGATAGAIDFWNSSAGMTTYMTIEEI